MFVFCPSFLYIVIFKHFAHNHCLRRTLLRQILGGRLTHITGETGRGGGDQPSTLICVDGVQSVTNISAILLYSFPFWVINEMAIDQLLCPGKHFSFLS